MVAAIFVHEISVAKVSKVSYNDHLALPLMPKRISKIFAPAFSGSILKIILISKFIIVINDNTKYII